VLLRREQRLRRLKFVLFCLLDIVPFLYARFALLWDWPVLIPVLIGFAYNMLKAVDALFYVYYTKRAIPFPAYANFLLFFPVLTGGPIFRYRDFIRYYTTPAVPTAAVTLACFRRMILGLFKKLVVVTWCATLVNHLLTLEPRFLVSLLLSLSSYALLYFDLSGYSDMAIACGTLAGIPTPENFKNPLSAASFTQFWRKWHVTLSDWIREHIFVVVNGKRLSRAASALIGFLTMIVMSLWHEFSLYALIDGAVLGAVLAAENLLGITTVDKRKTKRWVYLVRCALVTLLFAVNAMFFTMSHDQLLRALGGFLK